ncbi:hypothetical protein DRP05_10500 [Archaeoglobales archaeon]|nr:MAG: hypothetical protein DRP05_10500 [Archaeoglobales archaeon]
MRKGVEELSEVEIIERYIILLLGVVNRPIPSLIHLEKELFILSKANPVISNFITFIKHHYGPYSDDVRDVVENPVYYPGAYEYDGRKIYLTKKGQQIYNDLIKKYSANPKFKELIGILKMIRELYEKLSIEELLFLIYITYPEYQEQSRISKKLLSKEKRSQIAYRLYKKGVITESRYREVVGDVE